VQQVLDRHAAECWLRTDLGAGRGALCVQLPTLRAAPPLRLAPTISRPIYYDFDLFHQPGQTAALDETALAALTFTVFDTETTGLSPSSGDEIVSIGAVRIVNGRLLEHEHFDRLVRPRKAVGEQALAVHGIGDEMLRGEPPIEQVLPAFARFAADTVLVAHNAAFDMRFLELARERTGIAFTQPVLDTLLLSEAVHPAHGAHEHHLEQIASRLGVDVHGRHTALGDAIVTGEVLLKLLPLLAARGVHTLGQAREASARTSHARLRY
jgi:DNA polymerase-3 subunit epsilon